MEFYHAAFISFIAEGAIAWLFFTKALQKKIELRQILRAVLIANAATLPFVWFIFPMFIGDFFISLFLSEIFATFVEAIIYSRLLRLAMPQAITLSAIANLVTFLIGWFA